MSHTYVCFRYSRYGSLCVHVHVCMCELSDIAAQGLAGLLTEHGPLVANAQGGLDYNPISWTRFATVVYLEQVWVVVTHRNAVAVSLTRSCPSSSLRLWATATQTTRW